MERLDSLPNAGSSALTHEHPHFLCPSCACDKGEKATLSHTLPNERHRGGEIGLFIFTEERGEQEAKAFSALVPGIWHVALLIIVSLRWVHLHSREQEASGRDISQLCVSITSPHPSPFLRFFSAFRKSLRNVNGLGEN